MFNHEPDNYECPYCSNISGKESDFFKNADIVAENDLAFAFICPMTWKNNPGNVVVIPKQHIENIFSIPDIDLGAVVDLSKKVSIAMRKTYGCSGITILQRNEPDAGQHVWHLHVHIVPRHAEDGFKEDEQTLFAKSETKSEYAQKIRDYLDVQS